MRLHAPRAAWRFLRRPRVFDALLVGLVLLPEGSAMLRSHLGDPGRRSSAARSPRPAAWSSSYGGAERRRRRGGPLALDLAGVAAGVDGPATTPGVVALYSVGRYTPDRTAGSSAGAGACAYLAGCC